MWLRPSQRLQLFGGDDQDPAKIAGAVGVSALEADMALQFVRERRRVAKCIAAMFVVGFGLVSGAIVGKSKERADRLRALGELFEECASLRLSGFLRLCDVLAFAPSEQSSSPASGASDQAAAERRAQSLPFRSEPRRCRGRMRSGVPTHH